MKRLCQKAAGRATFMCFCRGWDFLEEQVQFFLKRGVLLVAKQRAPIVPVHIDGVWGSIFSMERGSSFFKNHYGFHIVCVFSV